MTESFRVPAPGFSLAHTLGSGQLFRYQHVPEGYLLEHRREACVVSQEKNELLVHYATPGVTREWLRHFLALDATPLQPVDEFSAQALAYCGGMRVCRQDPWECTVGFLCSQNNSISRIRQLMTGLARAFGTPIQVGPYTAHTFPEPGAIRASPALSAIKAGYRERYLLAANERLTDEALRSIGSLPYEDAKAALLDIDGVGPKVAECILLFAYGHQNAFPVDTWVEQIMREQYRVRSRKRMPIVAARKFGPTAGLMQQYLFHYKRTGLQQGAAPH